MSNNLRFEIKKLSIFTKYGQFEISTVFQELNLYDSVLTPCITGNVIIIDTAGISSKLSFDGSEVLVVDLLKQNNLSVYRKAFRIYKQSKIKNLNTTSEIYVLHFVSEEFILSQQVKITQSYKNTYTNVVSDILKTHLKATDSMISQMEKSVGIRDVVIPNKSPFSAINFCEKRAINSLKSPTFLFFENKLGYNFITTSTLIQNDPIFELNYEPKNLSDDAETQNQIKGEMFGIRAFEVVTNHDLNKNIQSGLYAGTFIGVDLRNRNISKRQINFSSINEINKMANDVPDISIINNRFGKTNIEMFNSKVSVFPSSVLCKESSYIKENYPDTINTDDDTYHYVFQRGASLRNLFQKRLKVVLPGNFDLTSGLNVKLTIPIRGLSLSSDNLDKSISGKYMISAARHIIRSDRHETILEIVTNSTNKDKLYRDSSEQMSVLADYE